MAQLRYVNTVPLGKISITAAGTPAALSQNCGPLAGQVASQINPLPIPGTPLIQITLQADSGNSGNLYLLPRGKTAAGNPEAIMVQLSPGGSVTFPSIPCGPSLLPENLVLDTDAVSGTQLAYGYGTLQG